MSKNKKYNERMNREKRKVAENYLSHAERFYDAGYRRDAYLLAEIGLKLDPNNRKIKDLISKL